ncbi:MAG: GerMN domain-containing protein [Lachnospiraceae bacterium]|nr:GerMN domain-containing protein [Lachnospiraceae bacterium]
MSGTKKILLLAIFVFMVACMTGCGDDTQDSSGGRTYSVYYVNNEETGIFSKSYQTATEDGQELLDELMGQLAVISEKKEYKAPLSGDFAILGYTLESGQLAINFDEHYKEMDSIKEILVRAAIVRTLSQVRDVSYISFAVNNEPLMDNGGAVVGNMSADMFIDNEGNEINTYEKVNLHLYFANETGDRLVEENQRNVVYNSNISIEKLVVEKLIEGPLSEGSYPTINPDTRIVSVTVKDRICYVNLDEVFLNQPYNVTSDVTIYSITNSLVELPNVSKVQISINGETSVFYKESVSLTTLFERNLDLITNAASADN